jgi:CSLREA domain-containing protein
VTGTITLTSGLPFISSYMTISGPGANQLTIQRSMADGTPRFRIFTISYLPQPPTVSISGLTITNGYSVDGVNAAQGGGVSADLDTTVNLTDMVIRGNTTGNGNPGSGGGGGGVFNFGTMTITRSTISGNTTGNGGSDPGASGGWGGGINNAGFLTLINSTVSGNTTGNGATATQGGSGGGIYSTTGRTVTLLNCTVTGNQAGSGGSGGGISNSGTANLKDTIVANNTISGSGSGPDLSGSFTSQDFNLIESASGASVAGLTTHNIIGIDPLLGPLAANGGSTLTHAPMFGSPAIDAANSSLTTDQRGQPRPIDDINAVNVAGGNASDIGAFEGHSYEVNSIADTSDGQCTAVATGNGCTLREAITAANSESGAELITFASPLTAGGPAEIELLNALPTLVSDMLIIGPGASQLTIRRSTAGGTPDFRIFNISSVAVAISGLTVSNGKTPDGTPGNSGSNGEDGGGIRNVGTLTLTDVNLTGNRTGAGGAGLNNGGFGGFGGAIANYGSVTMTNCHVTGNITGNGGAGNNLVGDGGRGGGIYNENNLTMTNCAVSANTTGDAGTTAGVGGQGGEGGGIYSRVGVLTLTNVTINNNVTGSVPAVNGNGASGGSGGGISTILGIATLTNCTISGNHTGSIANGNLGYGGAISNSCPMTIHGSTISNNTGNAAILNRRPLVITNSTLSANHSVGINNDSSATLTLTNCTVATNDSFGVVSSSPSPMVRNTIIANNGTPGAADINGTFNTQGHNLIGVNGPGMFGPSGFTDGVNGDKVGTSANPLNARLAPLANYGGPTQTHALLPGSPALDAGDNCVFDATCSPALGFPLTTDQRGTGFSRRADSADADIVETVDIGAFESHVSIPDFADNFLPEDTPLALGFNVGDEALITNITATSSNATLVPNLPANLSVTGGGATRTLNITPVANQFGTSTITVTVTSGSESMSDTFVLTVTAVPDTPSVTPAITNEDTQTNSGLVISRNAADGAEVTHFWIRNITNGTLFKHDGITQINNGNVITFAEGNAGLKFTPAANLYSPATSRFSFDVQGSADVNAGVVSSVAQLR